MPTLRHRVLNASGQPVSGYAATVKPYAGSKYAGPKQAGRPVAQATSGADGWLSFDLPEDPVGYRRTFWLIEGPNNLRLVAAVAKGAGTVSTGTGTTLGTLETDHDFVPDTSVDPLEQGIPARLSDATLRAAFVPVQQARPGNLAVFLGDSLTLGGDDAVSQARGDSWPVYLSMLSGQRVRYVRNSGIAGQNSTQILARFDTDVTPYAPNLVTLLAGRNDIQQGAALATIVANLTALVAKVRGIGAVPVLCTIPPTGLTSPANSKQATVQVNGWIRRYAAAQGITLLDFHSVLTDPATGGYLAAYNSGDNLHPNAAGLLVMATYANTVLTPLLPNHAPMLCRDAVDENSEILNGVFSGYTGTGLPTSFVDLAGAPAGSALSYTTDAAVPGQLLTITSTATAALRKIGQTANVGTTTMPAVAAGATTFVISVNPFQRGVLFIGSGATAEVVKVASVTGSAGAFTVTLTRGLAYAHVAGEPVVVNAQPGDRMIYSGIVTTDGGVTFTAGVDNAGAAGVKAANNLTRALTRATFHIEFTLPTGSTQMTPYVWIGAGTGVVSVGQLGLYNLTKLGYAA